MTLREAITRVAERRDLSADEMTAVMGEILAGTANAVELAGWLVGLRVKGESVTELLGAALALRQHGVVVPNVPEGAVDTCGTGGDGASMLNVSTAAGLVVAAAGVAVAKHGNRAVSGTVGGADVLEALGIDILLDAGRASACLRELGFVFLFAPSFHPALQHAAPVRRALGVRTVFNLLGPLCNPARVPPQAVRVFAA